MCLFGLNAHPMTMTFHHDLASVPINQKSFMNDISIRIIRLGAVLGLLYNSGGQEHHAPRRSRWTWVIDSESQIRHLTATISIGSTSNRVAKRENIVSNWKEQERGTRSHAQRKTTMNSRVRRRSVGGVCVGIHGLFLDGGGGCSVWRVTSEALIARLARSLPLSPTPPRAQPQRLSSCDWGRAQTLTRRLRRGSGHRELEGGHDRCVIVRGERAWRKPRLRSVNLRQSCVKFRINFIPWGWGSLHRDTKSDCVVVATGKWKINHFSLPCEGNVALAWGLSDVLVVDIALTCDTQSWRCLSEIWKEIVRTYLIQVFVFGWR